MIRTSSFVGLKLHLDPCFSHVRFKFGFDPYLVNVGLILDFVLHLYLHVVQVEFWSVSVVIWGPN